MKTYIPKYLVLHSPVRAILRPAMDVFTPLFWTNSISGSGRSHFFTVTLKKQQEQISQCMLNSVMSAGHD